MNITSFLSANLSFVSGPFKCSLVFPFDLYKVPTIAILGKVSVEIPSHCHRAVIGNFLETHPTAARNVMFEAGYSLYLS